MASSVVLQLIDESQSVDARCAWFAAQSLNTAQTLWLLVGRQQNFQRSINAVVRQRHSCLQGRGSFMSAATSNLGRSQRNRQGSAN
jgi:hypothetical protein